MATVFCILGIIGVFTGNISFIFAGGVANIAQNIIAFVIGSERNFTTIIVAVLAGLIYAYFAGLSLLYGAMVGLCFEGAIMGVWSIYYLISSINNRPSKKRKVK